MEWIREGEVSFPRTPSEPDSVRAWRPWVLEEPDPTLRMWYTGSDGMTSRILTAERPPGGGWERLGVGDHFAPANRADHCRSDVLAHALLMAGGRGNGAEDEESDG